MMEKDLDLIGSLRKLLVTKFVYFNIIFLVKSESLKKDWYFLCGKWFSNDKSKDGGQIERELLPAEADGQASAPLVSYKVSVTTGDRPGAGTDAQ